MEVARRLIVDLGMDNLEQRELAVDAAGDGGEGRSRRCGSAEGWSRGIAEGRSRRGMWSGDGGGVWYGGGARAIEHM
jgi:hypothetical protein